MSKLTISVITRDIRTVPELRSVVAILERYDKLRRQAVKQARVANKNVPDMTLKIR